MRTKKNAITAVILTAIASTNVHAYTYRISSSQDSPLVGGVIQAPMSGDGFGCNARKIAATLANLVEKPLQPVLFNECRPDPDSSAVDVDGRHTVIVEVEDVPLNAELNFPPGVRAQFMATKVKPTIRGVGSTRLIRTSDDSTDIVWIGMTFADGKAPGSTGGGVFLDPGGTHTFVSCRFINNRARIGSAIANVGGFVSVYQSDFLFNKPAFADTLGDQLRGGAIDTGGITEIWGAAKINGKGEYEPGDVRSINAWLTYGSSASERTKFAQNAANSGGAINCHGGLLVVRNGDFEGNVAAIPDGTVGYSNLKTAGGAIRIEGSCNADIDQSRFYANDAIGPGSHVSVDGGASAKISNSTFREGSTFVNTAYSPLAQGGAISARNSNLVLTRSSIRSNTSNGGALAVNGDGFDGGVKVANNTLEGNDGREQFVKSVVDDLEEGGYTILLTTSPATGFGGLVLRNIPAQTDFGDPNGKNYIMHNAVVDTRRSLAQVVVDGATMPFRNNLITHTDNFDFFAGAPELNRNCLHLSGFGNSSGNSEYTFVPAGSAPTPSCGFDNGAAGSTFENSATKVWQYGAVVPDDFALAVPLLYAVQPHPGVPLSYLGSGGGYLQLTEDQLGTSRAAVASELLPSVPGSATGATFGIIAYPGWLPSAIKLP